jgi:hypothetical protein
VHDLVSIEVFNHSTHHLIIQDEASVGDRQRLLDDYGVKSVIDLRTKYVFSSY